MINAAISPYNGKCQKQTFWGSINSHLQGFSLVSDKKNRSTNNEISFCETQNEMMTLEEKNGDR